MSTAPFHEQLDAAIEQRGLSLAHVRHHLRRRGHDLSVSTLSYWRRGLTQPTLARSVAAVGALEEVLGLSPRALTDTLTSPAERHVEGASPPDVEEMASRLGLSWSAGMRRLSLQVTAYLDERGRVTTVRHRAAFYALVDGLDRLPVAVGIDDTHRHPVIEALAHCAVGREIREPEALMCELLLPHPLQRGDGWVVEYEVRLGASEPMRRTRRYVPTRIRDLHLAVVFHPDHLPLRAECTIVTDGLPQVTPLALRGPSLDVHLEDFGPGSVELGWAWGEDR